MPDEIPEFSVPQYFEEIFDKYGLTEKGYDLKVILSSEEKKQEFLDQIKVEIENDKSLDRYTKKELWKAIKSSWNPIIFGILWAVQGVVEIRGPKPPISIISAIRTTIFYHMSKDALKLSKKSITKSKDQQLFEEVVNEIDNLQKIVGIAKLDSKFGFEEEAEPVPKFWPFKSTGN